MSACLSTCTHVKAYTHKNKHKHMHTHTYTHKLVLVVPSICALNTRSLNCLKFEKPTVPQDCSPQSITKDLVAFLLRIDREAEMSILSQGHEYTFP